MILTSVLSIKPLVTFSTTGVGRWNHRGSWLLSIFFLFTILSMNIADLVNFLVKGSSFIFSLSYLIFLTELSLFPFFNVYSKFKTSTQDRVPIASWFTTLNARFITRRLQFIDFREKGKESIITCVLNHVISLTPLEDDMFIIFEYKPFSLSGLRRCTSSKSGDKQTHRLKSFFTSTANSERWGDLCLE